jgi:hypothetical protein
MRKSLVLRVAPVLLVLIAASGSVLVPGTVEARGDFSVKNDSFSISNAPGYCFAMAAFSRWYYLTKSDDLPLRKAFSPASQRAIAMELQKFYSESLVGLQADYCNTHQADQTESFQRFLTGLLSGEPRVVLLMRKGLRRATLHAVLAYGWIPEKNMLRVYDPNYCNEERLIDLSRRKYSSLDVTYHAICFPEGLQDHTALTQRMEALCQGKAVIRPASAPPSSASYEIALGKNGTSGPKR